MNRRDVWMDILPSFERVELGLNLALLSDRFDVLVDAHFDGKTTELTLWRTIEIRRDSEMPKLFVEGKSEGFPMPDRPLPNKIRFKHLWIKYIDHSVIEFLRSNQQIWDRSGTKLEMPCVGKQTEDDQTLCDAFAHEIWPIFATNIRYLSFANADQLDILRRRTSPTILTDLKHLNAIDSGRLCPDVLLADDFDGPNATAGQALAKWLHTPTKDGHQKRLSCFEKEYPQTLNGSTISRRSCHTFS